MTGLLKSVMHEHADHLDTPHPDLDAIVAAGDRRVRRTRVAAAVAGVAAATVVATAAPFAASTWLTSEPDQGPATTPAFQDRQVTYAVGSVIHFGDRTFDAGHEIRSYVRTQDGFVFATDDGEVFFTDGKSTVSIGQTNRQRLHLASDDEGSLVGWVEYPQGAAPEFVIFDTSARERILESSEGNRAGVAPTGHADSPRVFAIDDGFAYWRSGDGLVRHEITTGTSTMLATENKSHDVADVSNGRIAHQTLREDAGSSTLRISTDLDTPGKPLPSGWHGYLSPEATYIAVDQADEMAVYDVATHEDVSPDTRGYAFVAAYDWLDEHTVLMIGLEKLDETKPFDILSCTVPAGSCTVAVDDAATFPGFAIPVGERIG